MFNKNSSQMAKTNDVDAAAINIIRKGTTIKGDINCVGDIRIDGTLKGKLHSEGKVVVGPSGTIDGEIVCKNADISGTINAQISVQELLLLKATANIVGDIKTNKLSIEPGANFTGSCNMGGVVKGIKHEEKQQAYEEATA
ncbi:MAG: polymer-forming cytoskeletal protein [Flavobacteriales bacterium]|nr:polymer-forming cytoskeletal protein [Flavobacteriales bacterium]MCB9335496.1 polymer-forming cytoskeletal protein [Flavobacteriales bacterium]